MSSLLRWMCVLALASALGACGDDIGDDGADGGDGDEVPMPIAEMISADDGGEIQTQGAAINIPPGALSEDTEITVEVIPASDVPESDSIASLVYDFGPDGTTFSEPVELTIALNTEVPEGMEVQMAWLDEESETWMPLADSRLEGDEVIATTDHFTMFAIVLSVTGGQTAGSCEDFADFEACGGDVAGTWEFAVACADLTLASIFGADNEITMCEGVTLAANIDISGSVTFEADGAYESEITRAFAIDIGLPLSCLPAGAMCAQLDNMEPGTEISEAAGVCQLSMDPAPTTEAEVGTYELDGNTLIMTMTGADPDAGDEYCVEGNTITVRNVDVDVDTGEETIVFLQATRQ
jgi:hypothetical protein